MGVWHFQRFWVRCIVSVILYHEIKHFFSRFICFNELQSSRKCENFEARFCCLKNTKEENTKNVAQRTTSYDEPEIPVNYTIDLSIENLRND